MPKRFYGSRLRYARLLATHSLDELGELVMASRQYVHQLEAGAKEPSADMWSALAAALKVTPDFFSKPLTAVVAETDCHFRRYLTAPRTVMAHAAARGTFVEQLALALETRLRLPKINFPHAASPPQSLNEVEQLAADARQHWKLKDGAPISNMTRVLERAGALVVSFGDLSDRVDALSISRGRPLVVRSSAKESNARARFDLAHECGHLIMHQGIVTGDQDTEEQANRFASAFLLPAKAFAREFPRSSLINWSSLYTMKLRWGVSVRAIIRRAYDLGLIDSIKYRSANIHLSKTGQTKREDFDEEIAAEPSETLPNALKLLAERKPVDLNMLVQELGLTPQLFRDLTGFSVPPIPDNVHVLQC